MPRLFRSIWGFWSGQSADKVEGHKRPFGVAEGKCDLLVEREGAPSYLKHVKLASHGVVGQHRFGFDK